MKADALVYAILTPTAQALFRVLAEQRSISQPLGVANSECRTRRWLMKVLSFAASAMLEIYGVDACAKEQTLRDLERLTAAGTAPSNSIRGSYNQQQMSNYMVSCTADMRALALQEDDMRVPSFLKNRPHVPMRRMQVPGMRPESGFSFCSSQDGSIGFLEMDCATIADYSNVVARPAPPSVCSSDASSSGKGKLSALCNSKVAKCMRGLTSWRKIPKPVGGSVRETPSIREDRDYDFAEESLPLPCSSLLPKGNCFMCLGGAQSTKYSIDESEQEGSLGHNASGKSSDFKSILLTTSPLYGDIQPTPRGHMDDLAYSTQHSLNIAATHNPATDLSESDSDTESEAPEEQRPVAEIWDDDDDEASDRDSAHLTDDACQLKQWDGCFTNDWVPPTLKTDQEYEMYQLQSRMEAESMVRKHLTRPQTSTVSHRHTPEELVDTASMSSWDVKMTRDSTFSKRSISHGSSSWSEFGVDYYSVASTRPEINKSGIK